LLLYCCGLKHRREIERQRDRQSRDRHDQTDRAETETLKTNRKSRDRNIQTDRAETETFKQIHRDRQDQTDRAETGRNTVKRQNFEAETKHDECGIDFIKIDQILNCNLERNVKRLN